MSLCALARSAEAAAIRLFEEDKPGRRLSTNVELIPRCSLRLGLDVPLFTQTYAVSRVSG